MEDDKKIKILVDIISELNSRIEQLEWDVRDLSNYVMDNLEKR